MKIIAHRGWSGRAPENTLPAFQMALDDPAVAMMECDVHLTQDDRVVVIHDYDVDRTSNGVGQVNSMTYEEMRQLDCGCWYDECFKGTHYPLLSELLALVDGKKPLVIELKRERMYYPKMAEHLLKVLESYPYKDKVYIKSFDHELIKELSEVSKDYKLGLLYYCRPILLMEQLRACNAKFVSLYGGALSEKLLKECLSQGIEIMAWTIDKEEDVETLWRYSEAIRIITNKPSIAEAVRTRREMNGRKD